MTDPYDPVHARLLSLPAFFVGGMPRSGTTWVQKLLNAHPEVLCLGESRYAGELVPMIYGTLKDYTLRRHHKVDTWGPTVQGPGPVQFGAVFRSAFAAVAAANIEGKELAHLVTVGEKTPDNINDLERIWKIFPKAKFINVLRDPRDGAVSGFARFKSKLNPELDRERYVAEYCRGWFERTRHARTVAADGHDYLEIRYEDLKAAPESSTAKLFAFLGVSTAPETVAAALEATSFEALSGGRKPGEEDPSSHYRRGEVGGWRGVLTATEEASALRAAGPLLEELGYLA